MGISMFSSSVSPIAIDFGTSSIKLMQVTYGARPTVVAIAELEVPDNIRGDAGKLMNLLSTELPRVIRKGGFRGKRACFSLPSSRTFITHLAVPGTGTDAENYIGMYLHAQTNVPPANMVIRSVEVKNVYHPGASHRETICFGVPRDVVMQYIELLKRCKLEVVGVHTEQHALVWAFSHIHRRDGDDQITNLFLDLGWGGTKVGISHGKDLVFSKIIHIGGRYFDQQIADTLHCDLPTARAHRLACANTFVPKPRKQGGGSGSAILDTGLALADADRATAVATQSGSGRAACADTAERREAGGLPAALHDPGVGSTSFAPEGIDFDELFECVIDELRMCLRYHRSMFEQRPIDRVIFVGGESQNVDLCRAIAARLNVPAVLGDPLARLKIDPGLKQTIIKSGQAQPGWAVACGLWSNNDES